MMTAKIRSAAGIIFTVIFALVLGFVAYLSFQNKLSPLPLTEQPRQLVNVTYQTETGTDNVALPAKIKNLHPRSPVTLSAQIEARPQESLLVKSVFAPMRVYIDGTLAFECGEKRSYPPYMNDPPTILAAIALPNEGGRLELRIEYLSPSQRNELSLPVMYIGSETALLFKLLNKNGFSLLFSLILIQIGAFMTLGSAVFIRGNHGYTSFFWLGLFSLAVGFWIFGECDLTVFLLPYPSLLYALDYLGLFLLSIPFLRFGMLILTPQNRLFLTVLLYIHYISATAAIFLQLGGVMDFTKSLYWFHIIAPLAFVAFATNLVWEFFRYNNHTAKRFAPAIIMIAASTVLELFNYWLGLTSNFTLIFQFGMLIFIISLCIISGYYVRDSIRTATEKQRLEFEVNTMGQQLALQREQYEQLTRNIETIKAMRHDLRHHLTVIGNLADSENSADIKDYIKTLAGSLAGAQEKIYCKNHAVNAVIAHYLGIAENEEVTVETQLDIPQDTGCVTAMDLCIIMGNLLENAVEACRRMKCDKKFKFIRVRSRIESDTLSIVVDNSFDGIWLEKKGVYLSRKERTEKSLREGIGLSSVEAVCEKYRGLTQYKISGDVWKSAALVHMENNENKFCENVK